jgi:Flp pilus assembly protein TadG
MQRRRSLVVSFLRRLVKARSGGVAITIAIALPVLVFVAVGAVDYTCTEADRVKMQGAADNAALSGAAQLAVDNSSTTAQRAQNFAVTQLVGLIGNWTLNVNSQVVNDGTAVQVTISGNRPALLNNLLPAGGWNVSTTATAQAEGRMPLCALGSGTSTGLLGLGSSAVINLTNLAQVTAPNCLIQSDQNIAAQNNAQVSAGAVQAVGQASGTISPTPQTGAPPIPDPFASTNINIPSLCTDVHLPLPMTGNNTLAPGVHCGTIVVGNNATLTLLPGVHYFFAATLTMESNAVLQGTNVALVFDLTSFFTFQDSSDIELQGLTSGPLAGFVIATEHDNVKTFTISTTSAHQLLGVVYIPSGLLNITGNSPVAEASAWTVIIAQNIGIAGSANLTLNANYNGSSVPVPTGVGPTGTTPGIRLTQ